MYLQTMKWKHLQCCGKLLSQCYRTRELTKTHKKTFATGGFEPTVAKLSVSSAGYLTHPDEETESQDTWKYNYTSEGRNVKVNKYQLQRLGSKTLSSSRTI